jgi:hypothetical protein
MKFGIVDKIFYDEYLSDHVCSSCGKKFSTKLVIYCKSFATGFSWWAWKKQGYIECNNCNAFSDIRVAQVHSKGLRSAFSLKSLPFRYFAPTIFFGSILAIFMLAIGINVFTRLTTSTKDNFAGIWEDRSHGYTLFVFEDNRYTVMTRDTVYFGVYNINKDHITLPVTDQNNKFDGVDPNSEITVNLNRYEEARFVKVVSNLKGDNPYDFRHNKWRLKAIHPESPAEIKKRVTGYLTFLKMRYEWALNNNLTYLPADLYSPLMMAQNGIAMNEQSMHQWAPIFYSKEDLDLANRFLYVTFPSDIEYDVSEPNVYKRNLKGINHYLQVAEATEITSATRKIRL